MGIRTSKRSTDREGDRRRERAEAGTGEAGDQGDFHGTQATGRGYDRAHGVRQEEQHGDVDDRQVLAERLSNE